MSNAYHRSSVPAEQRWDHADLFADIYAWDAGFGTVEERIPSLAAFKGTLSQGPEQLANWIADSEAVERDLGRLNVWTSMASNVDSNDEEASDRADRIRALGAKLAEATSFALPELIDIGVDTLRAWMSHPALADRERWLERLEQRIPHVRSAEIEGLLGALQGTFAGAATTHSVLANAELDPAPAIDGQGVEHAVTQARISTHLESPDRSLRESAWKAYADAHLARKRTMANLLVTGARQTNLLANVRKYDDALAMTLAPLEVPRSVITALLETYERNLGVWHRWFELKRRHLGLDRLAPWDVAAPVCPTPPAVTYEASVDWLAASLAPLGEDYVSKMRDGALSQGWVDRAPNDGKRMGAFSTGSGGSKPYIMMSWTEDLGSASTLVHELGHSMHSLLSWSTQPYPYARYTLFAAEVASNFNQAMMRDHLFEQYAGDRNFELAILDETMANFGRYFLIMPTLMRFEMELHDRARKGTGLSADALNELLADLFAEAYGPSMDMDRDRVGITWAQFHTHLYSRFYVFMYATGIAGAHAFAKRIQDGVPGAADAYLAFLREGGRTPPLTALERAGVDLSSPQPVEDAFATLSRHVDRFEKLLEDG